MPITEQVSITWHRFEDESPEDNKIVLVKREREPASKATRYRAYADMLWTGNMDCPIVHYDELKRTHLWCYLDDVVTTAQNYGTYYVKGKE